MKNYFGLLIFFFSFSLFSSEKSSLSIQDSLKIEQYKNHISTLKYISRENHNNDYFLDLALKYIDSIRLLEKDNNYVGDIEKAILLTKNTIQNNVISKIEFFKFYSGLPPYYGFVDDAIEYAYDDALSQLLNTKYKVLGNVPLSDASITSILVRKSCDSKSDPKCLDDERFEIINQTLISNTNHRIIQSNELIPILGMENSSNLLKGSITEENINKIIDYLQLDRLGIFTVNNIDVINNEIWLVNTDFKTYEKSEGFLESIFAKGYTVDKRDLLFFYLLVVFILAIIFVSLAYGLSLIFIDRKNIFIPQGIQIKNILSHLNKVKYVALYFLLPIILSFIMIYVCSFIIPRGDVDVGEINVRVWILLLTILMSFLPIIINFFFVNTLNIEGFHTPSGYTFFFNSSLYATYFPIFIFYFIQYGTYSFLIPILLIFVTLLIGNILGRSYFKYGIKTKNSYMRRQAITGLVLGLIWLIIFNRIIIYELSVSTLFLSFIIITPISILHYRLDIYFDRLFSQKSKEATERKATDEVSYVKSVMNPAEAIYKKVEDKMLESDNLKIMLIEAPMGIGKTRSLVEAEQYFEQNNWDVFYGDCNEIQDDNAVSFGPFLQAFRRLIGENWKSRSESTDKMAKGIIKIASEIIDIDNAIDYGVLSSAEKNMNEISLEIIDGLTNINKKVLFVMEDVHWIDPETLTLLKHFIKTINRNLFLRKHLCIIITVRAEIKGSYRGLNYHELKKELDNLKDKNNIFDLSNLLDSNSFDLTDFVKNLSVEDNGFKMASSSMNRINTLFNKHNEQLQSESKDKLTPRYIINALDVWRDEHCLIYTPDGYVLAVDGKDPETIDMESLPDIENLDSYYHKIFDDFGEKWCRVLESASVIGNKFDADILAQVWGYNLLDVLDFLEKAVNEDLLIDVSNQDNIYMFSDKRIISALKSYFKEAKIKEVERQIVKEYNKRYLKLQSPIIENPEKYDTEDLLKVIRRMIPLTFSYGDDHRYWKKGSDEREDYVKQSNNLILDVICRYLYSNKLGKLDAFTNLLESYDFNVLADLLKKLRIIADDVNFSISEKQKILDELIEEKIKKSKLTLPVGVEPDELANDLRLLIILNGEIMNTSEKSIVTFSDAGFTADSFQSFIQLPSKLNGLSLIYFIKEFGDINLSFDDDAELILSGGYEWNQDEIEESQREMFDMVLKQLKHTNFNKLAIKEFTLWDIEQISSNISDNQEKIQKIVNKYEHLLDTEEDQNSKFLYDSINSYLNFCHLNFMDGKKSNEVFISYNEKLKIDGKITEAWVLIFIRFMLSTTHGSNSVRPGEIYILNNPETADKNFEEAHNFLNKILETNSVTNASMWFLDAKKIHYLSKKDFNSYKKLQEEYLERLKSAFTEESEEFNKACVLIADDLEWQSENESKCPDFYNDCIILGRKSLKHLLDKPLVSHSHLAHQYQKIASLYIKKKTSKKALDFSKKALDQHHKKFKTQYTFNPPNWDFIDGELIPLSENIKELFYTNSGKERKVVVDYGLCILNYARCLSIQKKYEEAIEMIDKACKYYYVFPKLNHLSQLEKGMNLFYNKSKIGLKLITNSLKNLDQLGEIFTKSEIRIIKKAKRLIKK